MSTAAVMRRVLVVAGTKVKGRSSSVEGLAGVLTDARSADVSQLRDSDGFAPFFPRFHQQLVPADTSESNVGGAGAMSCDFSLTGTSGANGSWEWFPRINAYCEKSEQRGGLEPY